MLIRRRSALWVATAALAVSACSVAEVSVDVDASRSDAIAPATPVADDPFVEVESTEVSAPASSVPEPEPTPTPTPEPDPAPDPVAPVDETEREPAPIPDAVPSVADPIDTEVPDRNGTDGPLADADVDEIIAELVGAGFCDPSDFEDEGETTAIHFVVEGVLRSPCFVAQPDGEVADVVIDDDPRLIAAWNELLRVAPTELVDDISLLVGYEGCGDCRTLAYVSTLDVAAEFFFIAVDVVAGTNDPDELRLTMLHELSHVFTQRPGEQLVVQSQGAPCTTFFNGNGCFTEGSYMWAWIQEFWPADILGTLPADGSVGTDDEAYERCDADARYTGSYAAVHPEEDFAETFSAYVYDVEVDEALTAKLAFFDRYPEFVDVRERARAAGLAGTPGEFEGCGI